jgi:hypothetical protein
VSIDDHDFLAAMPHHVVAICHFTLMGKKCDRQRKVGLESNSE